MKGTKKTTKTNDNTRPLSLVIAKDLIKPDLMMSQKVVNPSTKSSSTAVVPIDPLNYERGSTVDLAMKLGSDRHVLMLLRAGHRPSRHGRIRLMDFAKLHGFANEANSILVTSLWDAVKEADSDEVADCIRHIDRRMIDFKDQTGQSHHNKQFKCAYDRY